GGGDNYTVQLGNLAGAVSVADSGLLGSDNLLVNGTPGPADITLTSAALTTPAETVNYTGLEFLRVAALDGADVFNVRSTNAATATFLDSGAGADTFNVTGTLAGNTTRLEGLGGADTFANDGALVNNGNLDVLAGPLTILGGDPGPLGSIDCDADPIGARDVLVLGDRAAGGARNYLVGPNSVTSNGPRTFAGVGFDGSLDFVRLDGTDQANIFDVTPSPTTQFCINGNCPA